MRVGDWTGPEEREGKPGRHLLPEMDAEGWPGGLGVILGAALALALVGALLVAGFS